MTDATLINSIKTPSNDLIDAFAMKPVKPDSLIIKNGVIYILGGVSSGKSTLLGKLMKIYDTTIEPMIFCFYTGLAPDETTSYHISNYGLKKKPYFIRLPNNEAMISFFNQFRYKRVKYSEMLLFMKSLFINDKMLIEALRFAFSLFNNLSKRFDHEDYQKRVYMLMSVIIDRVDLNRIPYDSELIMKTYAKKRKIDFLTDPVLFIANIAVSLSKGLKGFTVGMVVDSSASRIKDRIKPIDIEPQLRIKNKNKIELIPSITVFDDISQFSLMTTERACPWIKDFFCETRRWQNTIIVAAQRYNLLNKSLRALTHTFFIGYSLISDDLPRVAKELPLNIMTADDFLNIYKDIKPFSFFVYNNKCYLCVINF